MTAKTEEKTRREFFGIKQCFLYQQRKGPAREREQASDLRPEAPLPVSDPPLTLLSSPLSLFFFFHSSHLLYLPPPPPKKGSHLDIISISLIPRSHCKQRGWRSLFND